KSNVLSTSSKRWMYFEWLLVSSSCYGDSSGQAERDFLYVKSSLSRCVYRQPYISLGRREIARVGGRFSWSWAGLGLGLGLGWDVPVGPAVCAKTRSRGTSKGKR